MAYGDLSLDAPEKPNKGFEGGACNRRSCQTEPALWYNHGMHKWYCGDCARDIGQDVVNKRDWDLRWKPKCGHDQFETREMIDERQQSEDPHHIVDPFATYHVPDEFVPPRAPLEIQKRTQYDRYRGGGRGPYGEHEACRPKQQSSSLKRLLGKTKRRK